MPLDRKPPMTGDEARENVTAMAAETKPAARRKLLRIALGPLGNLSDEARTVYQAALDADGGA